jgi:PKD repeat protein
MTVSGPKGNNMLIFTDPVSGKSKDLSAYSFQSNNPTYSNLAGNYTVYLTAKDSAGQSTSTSPFTVAVTAVSALPDLTVSATVASNYSSNQTVQIPVTVARTGGNLINGTYAFARLYWSTTATWESGDSILWSANEATPDYPNSTLNSTGSKTVSATITIPSVSSGTYYIIAYVDPTGFHNETSENNNIAVYTVMVVEQNCSITVAYPNNGGEIFTKGQNYYIRWTSVNVVGNVKVEIYKGTQMVRLLAANDPNDGSCPFTPDNTFADGSDYRIAVAAVNSTASDYSNSYFSIQGSPLIIGQQPISAPPGTHFAQWGTGFTPDSTATLYFKKPDGTVDPSQHHIDAIGHFEIDYPAPWDKPSGTYIWWAIDGVTGAKSNEISYVITPLSTILDVQPINPQSDEFIYKNFFPSPNSDQLIAGGSVSSVIAADGESRLLLRVVANNNPGKVTISESQGNTQQNGSVSTLDDYRDALPTSSASVQLNQYGSQYIGFAVYRAPKDFSIPGYENRLTRPITLTLTSTGGNSTVSLTLRRTPIIISHGLWSGPHETGNAIQNFSDAIWNRFEDRGGKNIDDYILLNDCKSENADSVFLGAKKTRNNIRDYLSDDLRKRGATVTQVDFLGHSMGGQWGRLVEQQFSKDAFTYDRGYLHKLITLDTPHIGSFVADIGQYVLDHAAGIQIPPFPNAGDYLCALSIDFKIPICFGAIKDLTSYGSITNLEEISVPSHAISGNKHIDTACVLLSASTWVSGGAAEPIVTFLKAAEKILKRIDPRYGCENWFDSFDFSTETDLVVDLHSQKGGLSGNQLNDLEHKHTASFDSDVNLCFFDLLNKGVNDNAFAKGFPASSALLDMQNLLSLKTAPKRQLSSENQTPMGNILFSNPVNGTMVQPGTPVNVELTLTDNLTLENVLIMAAGSDAVELVNPPYTAVVTVPADAYDTYVISALGEGTDGNLYSASVTLSVVSSAVLQSIDVKPKSLYLELGQSMNIEVTGTYSDGSVRNLNTSTQGTFYTSSDESLLSVSENGTVIPIAIGMGYVQVSPASAEPVIVRVEITTSYMTAGFSANHLSGNLPLTVQFKDLSVGYFTSWSWNFGDGTTSTERNPSYTYQKAGAYTVSLTVTGNGTSDTATKNNYITVQSTVFVDTDNDGIDDTWETTYFGNLTTATATSDFDKDGYSDKQEYLNSKNGEDDPNGNPYDPKVVNEPGGTGYSPVTFSVLVSNSIGSRNTIKISDMTSTLPASGGLITVSAWDVNGNALPESGSEAPLKLYNHGTISISGSVLAERFLNGTPMLYKFSIDSSKGVISNVKNSTNDTFKVPVIYLNGMTNFAANSIGNYNTIKISDISGTLPTTGSTISVLAWDANGNALPESGNTAPLILYNRGTTSISGSSLAARFPTGSPMIYEFDVQTEKVLITNVKNSTDGKLNIPVAYTSGVSNFVSNSTGNNNTLEISDLSGSLPFGGGAITVLAWDASGYALPESENAGPLTLLNHGTISISGLNLAARFPTGKPMTYEFFIESSKVLITNVKSSTDGLVEIPSIFTSGISNFATNYVSSLNTIKISDTSGTLPAEGVAISITAWDTNGNVVLESGSAAPLMLYSHGTIIIGGTDLQSRFISGFPTLYEFSIGSSNAIVTSLTTSADGTIKTPTVFTVGAIGGI